ncbi:AraC family transcriptional regulator [Sporosarcina sp. P7]|nr:AraC family transcriptional regulator [Sporosarcina sp. P7]
MRSHIYRMSGVILMTSKNIEASNLDLIRVIEKEGNTEQAKLFFYLEKEFLTQIFNLEKDGARSSLKEIREILYEYKPRHSYEIVKYYFIILSSIITRRLQKESIFTEENAFIFNVACIEMIETNLHRENLVEIGDELVEFYCYILKGKIKPSLSHETVNEVIQYINENVKNPLIVDEIAKHFNVSTSHLSRIFREHTSVTLVEYITIRKIEEIQFYLRFSTIKIAEIAERFHFCNQSYFTRVFKKYTGLTPRRFRKELDRNYFQFTLKKGDSL